MSHAVSPIAQRLDLTGQVQGVGFRPFVYRLAQELGIAGWVRNANGRVEIHAEGRAEDLARFRDALLTRAPAIAHPTLERIETVPPEGHADFVIRTSEAGAEADIHVPPDYFTCDDCLRELADPADRRHAYPFINCTQCGPRYTLITALPYDRPNTAMANFPLCPACRKEYEDPADRRFHAEPVACPVCGPHLRYRDSHAQVDGDEAAIAATVAALEAGRIVAVKGIGGYHLMCDAQRNDAVAELRRRKRRPAKPLAVMFPADRKALFDAVQPAAEALALLDSPARPIVLMPVRPGHALSQQIAPGLIEIGCLLPYSPLHHLLLERFGGPLVATSGNVSGEPVLTEALAAETRLGAIADAFLHHDRPIVRPADDSVYRVIAGRPRPIRLGRGCAPLELDLPEALPEPVLALGSHMKNTVCLAWGRRAVLSPHIGELDTARSLDTLRQVAEDLQRLYQVRAGRLLLDRHPGYGYRHWARETGLPLTEIWHHNGHASALAWEFPAVKDWIVFAWDGIGLGEDGTLWGGEALVGGPGRWRRAAGFRPFHPPGGDRVGREPWRSAAALLWATGQPAEFAPELVRLAWEKRLNCPASSAAGRLFDAAAALTGVCREASYEGEGPIRLEALATATEHTLALPLETDADGILRCDWSPLLPMLTDAALPQAERAGRFHVALADALVAQAVRLRESTGSSDVGLTGGVFQNRLLTQLSGDKLASKGFTVHLPERIPVNDAGLSLGQTMEYLCRHE
jgi:hydrogenase maturation protein HypF